MKCGYIFRRTVSYTCISYMYFFIICPVLPSTPPRTPLTSSRLSPHHSIIVSFFFCNPLHSVIAAYWNVDCLVGFVSCGSCAYTHSCREFLNWVATAWHCTGLLPTLQLLHSVSLSPSSVMIPWAHERACVCVCWFSCLIYDLSANSHSYYFSYESLC